ncbi:hypothetical protein [Pseudomonas brassicacearum]|uniref:Uncharacterized protein n=1 Tax=Pseudomonas brassicacearum TaxID=930166 RepID=A0A423GP01_9PSED|nr:hypothetical protein [Pseudomonas brassicacearum]ROM94420.1 hypothetical protein BK658_17860 [Pseudomonas brassicacearum]
MLTKDDIPRLRAEARQFRDYAKHSRAEAAKCKKNGDWLGKLKADTRATEHVRVAQDRGEAIKALKAA